jgi:hypothetical protein
VQDPRLTRLYFARVQIPVLLEQAYDGLSLPRDSGTRSRARRAC